MHACVAATSYGKPSMLFSQSPRVRLLERVGLAAIREKPVALDLHVLEKEKQKLISFLKEAIH
jgi:hypothetical protein